MATERARSLTLDEREDHVLARIARIARAATGLSQALYAAALDRAEHTVEKDEDATHARMPNLRDELNMPQEAFEAHVRAVIAERARRGFPLMQLTAVPSADPVPESELFRSYTKEAADLTQALATGAPADVIVKEAREAREKADEVIASRLRAA